MQEGCLAVYRGNNCPTLNVNRNGDYSYADGYEWLELEERFA
jgi:hypothetical protein